MFLQVSDLEMTLLDSAGPFRGEQYRYLFLIMLAVAHNAHQEKGWHLSASNFVSTTQEIKVIRQYCEEEGLERNGKHRHHGNTHMKIFLSHTVFLQLTAKWS